MRNFSASLNDLYAVCMHTAFIVIPFKESWSDDVTYGIKSVCENLGIDAKRADDLFDTQQTITQDIIKGICQAELVIVDITVYNPNVFYELGIAEALGKDIILLHQKDGQKIPSDISNKRYLSYGMFPTSFEKFKKDLGNIIKKIKKAK